MSQKEDNQKKKAYLWSYQYYKRLIKIEEERLHQFELDNMTSPGIQYSDMPHAGGSNADLSSYIVRKDKYIVRILQAKRKYQDKRDEIHDAIHSMENLEYRELLDYWYLQRRSWKYIGQQMGYEKTTVYKLHGKALNAFQIPEGAENDEKIL